MLISQLIVLIYATKLFSLLFIPLFFLYFFIQRYFVPTYRQMMRIQSKARGPIISHFQESVQGQNTIRAFRKGHEFQRKNESLIDKFLRVQYCRESCTWWLHSRMDIISSVVVFGAIIFAVYGRHKLSVGDVALAINYSLR